MNDKQVEQSQELLTPQHSVLYQYIVFTVGMFNGFLFADRIMSMRQEALFEPPSASNSSIY